MVLIHDYSDKPSYDTSLRRCKKKDCSTKLSRYNLNKYCHAHRYIAVAENIKEDERKRVRALANQKRHNSVHKETIKANKLIRKQEKERDEMKIKDFCSEVALAEGKEKQATIGNVREIIKIVNEKLSKSAGEKDVLYKLVRKI